MKFHWALDQLHRLDTLDSSKTVELNLCELSDLGDIGFHRRDVLDTFEVDLSSSKWSQYKAFWNHDAKK